MKYFIRRVWVFYFLCLGFGVSACASAFFVIGPNQEMLGKALKAERIYERKVVPFVVTIHANNVTNLPNDPSVWPWWRNKGVRVRTFDMLQDVIHSMVIKGLASEDKKMIFTLLKINYTATEYGFGTEQPNVWITLQADYKINGRTVSRKLYQSGSQCSEPIRTGAWASPDESSSIYFSFAIYKAMIVTVDQAINKSSSGAIPVDRSCVWAAPIRL